MHFRQQHNQTIDKTFLFPLQNFKYLMHLIHRQSRTYKHFASATFVFARSSDFKREDGRSADTEVGCHLNNFVYNAGEISGLLSTTIIFTSFFSKCI